MSTALMSTEYPVIPWAALRPVLLRDWKQGEHVAIIGPTGVGKTTLISRILDARKYVVVFCTKVHDDTLSKDFPGFDRIESWPPKSYQNKVLLWPKITKAMTIRDTYEKQRQIFQHALNVIFHDRNWTPVCDEQLYMCEDLKLAPENKMYSHQGRSSGLSCVNSTQRPSGVPLVTYSGSTHYFVWKNTIDEDLSRLANIGGVNKRTIYPILESLSKHEFLYGNTRTGFKARSQVER